MKYRVLVALFIATSALAPDAFAQSTDPLASRYYKQSELRVILAPLALYPDELLANTMMAATYPEDLLEANDWAKANTDLIERGGDPLDVALSAYGWDRSVKALLTIPPVLEVLVKNIDTTTKLLADIIASEPAETMDAIQDLRFRANDAGLLATDKNVTIAIANGVLTITSNDRTTIYLPRFNSDVVFGPRPQSDSHYTPPAGTPPVFYRGPVSSSPYWAQTFWLWSTHQIVSGNLVWDPRPPVLASIPAPPPTPSLPAPAPVVVYQFEYERWYYDFYRHRRDPDWRNRPDRRAPPPPPPRRETRLPPPSSPPPRQEPPRVTPPPPPPVVTNGLPDSTPSLRFGLHGGGGAQTPATPTPPAPRVVNTPPAPAFTPPPRRVDLPAPTPTYTPPPPPPPAVVHNDPPASPPQWRKSEPTPRRVDPPAPAFTPPPPPPPAPAVVRNDPPPPPPAPEPNPVAKDSSPALKCGLRGCGTPK